MSKSTERTNPSKTGPIVFLLTGVALLLMAAAASSFLLAGGGLLLLASGIVGLALTGTRKLLVFLLAVLALLFTLICVVFVLLGYGILHSSTPIGP